MPPKQKKQEPSKKNVEKKKEKVIEDKTFGLKNKKGKKQQEYVKQIKQQVKCGGNPLARKHIQDLEKKKQENESKKKEKDEVKLLFKPVTQKVSAGADPQSVVCAFFKQGQCSKGDKCKFSHDLTMDRKGEKRSMYVDKRDADTDLQDDTMDKWDQQKLEEVIEKKHGVKEKCMPKTEIVCKFFLEALERNLYGWFWSCPNGDKCIYRHALPPGFVLKKNQEKDSKEEISIEEFIETERMNLGSNLTKVTLETFLKWKQRKLKEKKAAFDKDQAKKKDDFKAGKIVGKVSGREVFQFKPELIDADADDDEQTEDMSIYRRKNDDDNDDSKIVDVTAEALAAAAKEADESGTQDKREKNKDTKKNPDTSATDVNGLDEACGGGGGGPYENGQENTAPVVDGVPIEESLFDEDIDDLELDELAIAD